MILLVSQGRSRQKDALWSKSVYKGEAVGEASFCGKDCGRCVAIAAGPRMQALIQPSTQVFLTDERRSLSFSRSTGRQYAGFRPREAWRRRMRRALRASEPFFGGSYR
jgi:hypothetical protein